MKNTSFKNVLESLIIISILLGAFLLIIFSASVINHKFHKLGYIESELNSYVWTAGKIFIIILSVTIILGFIKLLFQSMKTIK